MSVSFLQTTQKDDVVTTEIILEFLLGPEETKVVRAWMDPQSAETGMHVCVCDVVEANKASA